MKTCRAALLALLPLVPSTLWAADCPPAPDHGPAVLALLDDVRDATTEAQARSISQQLWELWADAPDEAAQELLDSGMEKRAGYNFLGALEDLDRLIAYCPHYAEGYNQRAFVNFLRQDFAAALPDLDEAIARSPNHVAAIAGKALTLLALGDVDMAREVFARALDLNPWLPERGLAASAGRWRPRVRISDSRTWPPIRPPLCELADTRARKSNRSARVTSCDQGHVAVVSSPGPNRPNTLSPRGGMVDTRDLKSLSLCGKTHTEQGVATKRLFSGPI